MTNLTMLSAGGTEIQTSTTRARESGPKGGLTPDLRSLSRGTQIPDFEQPARFLAAKSWTKTFPWHPNRGLSHDTKAGKSVFSGSAQHLNPGRSLG